MSESERLCSKLLNRLKDIGSAAVFVALVNVVAVWGLVLFA